MRSVRWVRKKSIVHYELLHTHEMGVVFQPVNARPYTALMTKLWLEVSKRKISCC